MNAKNQVTNATRDEGMLVADFATSSSFWEKLLAGAVKNAAPEVASQMAECQGKFEEMRTTYLRDGNFLRYLITFESHERLQPFLDIIPRLSDREYWKILREVWIGAEVILPDKQIWLQLLRLNRPGREHLMTESEHAALADMPDTIQLWRGCGHESTALGLSWTLDQKRALVFADYACGPRRQLLGLRGIKPILVEATCRKKDVLAYFTARQEAEIVINPEHVTELRIFRLPALKREDPMEIKQQLENEAPAIIASMDQPANQPVGK